MVFFTLLSRALHKLHLNSIKYSPEGNRIVSDIHVVLPESKTRHHRCFIVGDIHGCHEEFQTLLDRCYFRPGVDVLLSVGDLVNKGPGSPQVLQMIKKYGAHAVRGNHDDAALAAYRDYTEQGQPPKKSKYSWVRGLDPSLADVMRTLPFTITLDAYNLVVVHAGLVPGVALESQKMEDMIKMRDVLLSSTLETSPPTITMEEKQNEEPNNATVSESEDDAVAQITNNNINTTKASDINENSTPITTEPPPSSVEALPSESAWNEITDTLASLQQSDTKSHKNDALTKNPHLLIASERRNPVGRAWAKVWKGPMHVVFGHDAGRRLQIEEWATGIDGGCVYGGSLYALVLPALDENGNIVIGQSNGDSSCDGLPDGAQGVVLGTGLVAKLVSVSAQCVHSPPKGTPAATADAASQGNENDSK